jgi:hypothetical protein
MRTILKTIIALFITAMTPILEYACIIFLFIGLILLSPVAPNSQVDMSGWSDVLIIAGWMLIMIVLPMPVAFLYVLLVGLPAFLVGWYFRAIRWWTTLITSFLIGAVPAVLTVAFLPTGWSGKTYVWQDLNVENFFMMTSSALLMGFFSTSGGLVFWLLWRFWVSPNSPAGRPLPSVVETVASVEAQ